MIEERELKLLIHDGDYERILSLAKIKGNPNKQTNYYFDTVSFDLSKKGTTLRIRNEDNEWLLCLKIKKQSNSLFNKSDEYEYKVDFNVFEECKNAPNNIINYFNQETKEVISKLVSTKDIVFLGSIQNERYKINVLDSYIFELDKSKFPKNSLSYELEVEGISSQDECNYIINFLENLGVRPNINMKSKYNRFLECLTR